MGENEISDDMLFAIHDIEPFQVVIASLSVLLTGSVVFILIQNYNELVRDKPFVHIILMMALADTMSSIALAFGFPENDIVCTVQGFIFVFFGRLSWFFLDFLVIQLYYFAKYQKLFFTIWQIHYVVWPISILLQVGVFLTKNGYGNSQDDLIDDVHQVGVCFYSKQAGSLSSYFAWSTFAFTAELLISFLFILVVTIIVLFLRDNEDTSILVPVVSSVKKTIILYPISQLITALPGIIYALYHVWYFNTHDENFPPHYVFRQDLLVAITPLNNIFFAIIFYTKTDEAMRKWKDIYRYIFNIETTMDQDRLLSKDSIQY